VLRLTLVLALASVAAVARAEVRPRPHVVRVEHRAADQNPSLGPADALVTAELFLVPGQRDSNFAYRKLVELQERHPRRLRVVFRVVLRAGQTYGPIAALEAYAQGRFEPFMAAVLASRTGTVKREHLPTLAEAAGLDRVRLDRAIDRHQAGAGVTAILEANDRRRLRRTGTGGNVPELLLNGLPIGQTVTSVDVDGLEVHYQEAYRLALELLDEGVPRAHLVEAAERRAAPRHAIVAYAAGPLDDAEPTADLVDAPPPLLGRRLDLAGLPGDGPADAPVEMIVVCDLRERSCHKQVAVIGRRLRELYADELRLRWHPWYDVRADGNEDAPRLHAAALCAEETGAGWLWLGEALQLVNRKRIDGSAEEVIERIAEAADVERGALEACLARGSAAVHARVQAAIAAGIRQAPAVVIGGRLYLGGFTDAQGAAPVLDAELAPGLLEQLVPAWGSTPRVR
jgi:hypothetical protein